MDPLDVAMDPARRRSTSLRHRGRTAVTPRLYQLLDALCFTPYGALFGWRVFRPLNLMLLNLACRGLGINAYGSFRRTGEIHALKKFRDRIDVVIDVGANRGNYTAEVLRLCQPSRVYCFEPHPSTAVRLAHRFRDDPRVEVIAKALSDRPVTVALHDDADADGTAHASLVPGVIERVHNKVPMSIEMEATTIDDVVRSQGLDRLDLLKIDVEGAELSVLMGASWTLRELKPRFVQFEFNEMNALSGTAMSAFADPLRDYDLFRLLPHDMIRLDRLLALECRILAFQTIWAIRRDQAAAVENTHDVP